MCGRSSAGPACGSAKMGSRHLAWSWSLLPLAAVTSARHLCTLMVWLFVSTASQNEVTATPLEELTYRRSLRVALDVLNERTSLSPESHLREEKPHADAASWVPGARSPSFCSEDGDSVAAQCTPKREWFPQSLPGLPAAEEDRRIGLTKNGTLRAALPSPAGDGSQDGSGSRLDCEQDTAKKRRRNLGEKPTQRRRTASCLSKGESVEESEGQANSCVTPASPGLLPQASEEDPCAGVKGCDPVVPSGSSRLLPASDRGRGRATKRPRLDGSQNPPPGQLATGTVGAVPSPQNWPGETMVLLRSSDRDKPEEGNHGQGPGSVCPLKYSDFVFSHIVLCV